jgi:hypothetical protein
VTDYAEWPNYLGALLRAPGTSVCHEIGAHVAELHDNGQILDYVIKVMRENPTNSRKFEIAWDVCALRVGLVIA